MEKKDLIKLKVKLLKEQKREGEISDETLEKLEDEYHVDLTNFYGESNNPKVVSRLIKKINKHN